jgi:hypothetical protein
VAFLSVWESAQGSLFRDVTPNAMKRFLAQLGDLVFHSTHSHFESELRDRPELHDQAFSEAYDADSGIPQEMPISVRKV